MARGKVYIFSTDAVYNTFNLRLVESVDAKPMYRGLTVYIHAFVYV